MCIWRDGRGVAIGGGAMKVSVFLEASQVCTICPGKILKHEELTLALGCKMSFFSTLALTIEGLWGIRGPLKDAKG